MKLYIMVFFSFITLFAGEAPQGASVTPEGKEAESLQQWQSQGLHGYVVWSSSRSSSRHDLWVMNANGDSLTQLTSSDKVDWFPRFSPDGKRILFTRSKAGWVSENDAKYNQKWDVWAIEVQSGKEEKLAENATWGTWDKSGQAIYFSRYDKVYSKDLKSGEETLLWDAGVSLKEGTIVQEPNVSPDGSYIAATLRGSSRETGIWDITSNSWSTSGAGCQIDWFPAGDSVYRVNPTGNGGSAAPSEILRFAVKKGKQQSKVGFFGPPKSSQMMDLEGRRSHEYFPKLSNTGDYMVWCATDKGHDHDIYDYEVYIWKVGEKKTSAVRLTWHTANDRWPDIYIMPGEK
jgi:Tol biopolymer transport system component